MPYAKGHKRAKVLCKGMGDYACDALIDAKRSISGLCRRCSSRMHYTLIAYIKPVPACGKSTEWITDALGVKTRYHGDV
jgi:hypothetical protein